MIDFEREGLLEDLEGEAREQRVRLLAELAGKGVTADELGRAVRDKRLMFLPAEIMVGGVAKYTPRELAQEAGVDLDVMAAMRRAHGLPTPDPDDRFYTEDALEGAMTTRLFMDAGLDIEDMLDVTRILGRGFAQAADAMRTVVLKLVLEPGTGEYELAQRYAERVGQLMPLVEPMLMQMLKLHLRHMVRTEAISAAEREAGVLPGALDVTVAFADLVGFTRVGEEVPTDELGRIAGRLADMTAELVRTPVRLVKTIGDAAMIVAPEPALLLEVALDLVDAADAEGQDFPQLRVGLAAGPAVTQAGDWYGQPVNLASRVTNVARAGSVLATGDVRDAAVESCAWSFAGARRLKGIREPVALHRARRL